MNPSTSHRDILIMLPPFFALSLFFLPSTSPLPSLPSSPLFLHRQWPWTIQNSEISFTREVELLRRRTSAAAASFLQERTEELKRGSPWQLAQQRTNQRHPRGRQGQAHRVVSFLETIRLPQTTAMTRPRWRVTQREGEEGAGGGGINPSECSVRSSSFSS